MNHSETQKANLQDSSVYVWTPVFTETQFQVCIMELLAFWLLQARTDGLPAERHQELLCQLVAYDAGHGVYPMGRPVVGMASILTAKG
ncbi:MAG: hypothetical protein LBG70_04600 [Bifidobacteriaceae bacterium]|jgi:hypothetical protein|nr:hypothetical protein [Bifidobacteriaceae bacterium]